MFKNIIKKFAAFGLVAVLCVPCCFAFAQMQEEPNDEKSYSQEDLPGLIEKASREKNYFVLDAYRSRVNAEVSEVLSREFIVGVDENVLEQICGLSTEEFAEALRAEAQRADMSREDAFLTVVTPYLFNEGEEFAGIPPLFVFFVDSFLNEMYGESYSK